MNILVVEDDGAIRELTKLLLETIGHQATLANSTAQAMKFVEENQYEVIISDCDLPRRNEGVEFLQHTTSVSINQHRPMPAKILMSGRHDGLQLNAASVGAKPLCKPYTIHDLSAAIKKALLATQVTGAPRSAPATVRA